jgi:hypothetical protein
MTFGYIFRYFSAGTPDSLGLYIGQSLCIILPPSLYAATIYMIFGRLVVFVDSPEASLIRPTRVTKIFVCGDVLAFLMQAGGGGQMANAKTANMVSLPLTVSSHIAHASRAKTSCFSDSLSNSSSLASSSSSHSSSGNECGTRPRCTASHNTARITGQNCSNFYSSLLLSSSSGAYFELLNSPRGTMDILLATRCTCISSMLRPCSLSRSCFISYTPRMCSAQAVWGNWVTARVVLT